MRRALWLFPLLLVGCKPGRQAAVSNDGRVASTVEGGTFVSGRGRVADGGDDVAWSPDGHTLAIATKGGVVLWPDGKRLDGLSQPLAFSPFGDRIAGVQGKSVVVRDLATGATRPTTISGTPQKLGWTTDGRPFAVTSTGLGIDGGPTLSLKTAGAVDAVPLPDGTIAYAARETRSDRAADVLNAPLRLGVWDPLHGNATSSLLVKPADLLGAASPRRLLVPGSPVLAPDGRRYALPGLALEAGARGLARLRALIAKKSLTPAEEKEAGAIVRGGRLTSVVVRVDPGGSTTTLWSAPADEKTGAATDLAFSPDGKWLAIAGKDGTVRVAFGE